MQLQILKYTMKHARSLRNSNISLGSVKTGKLEENKL